VTKEEFSNPSRIRHSRENGNPALGFEAVDACPLRIARLLEAYGMLWIDQALNRGRGQSVAFAPAERSPH
jgi:hypothetical protein